MYRGVADPDSYGVFLQLASDVGRRSLVDESSTAVVHQAAQ
jgi:hypothetical protein